MSIFSIMCLEAPYICRVKHEFQRAVCIGFI